MLKKINFFLASLFIILVIFSLANKAEANHLKNNLKIEIDKESFFDPNYLEAELIVEKDLELKIITSQIELDYDPVFLELESIDFSNSWCSIVATSSVNTELGHASFLCGNPRDNNSKRLTLAKLKFKKNKNGLSKLSLSRSMLISKTAQALRLMSDIETHYVYVLRENSTE